MTTGFAVRKNGSCLRTETDCGETVGGFRGCCPGGTFCPHAYNIDCCPAGKNCTESLVQEPRCANATWDLYDNGGYFCCPHDTIGFALAGQYDGCAGTGYSFGDQDTRLEVISSGTGTFFVHTSYYVSVYYMWMLGCISMLINPRNSSTTFINIYNLWNILNIHSNISYNYLRGSYSDILPVVVVRCR